MASTYSDLKIELIGTGEQTGTWGTTTNNNFSVAVGEAITGSADVAFSSADVTVTLTDTNAAQTARNLRLNLTGTSGGARNLILGSGCQIEKLYLINNGLADAVTVKNTSGTGIAVPAGKSMFVFNNGTNVVEATSGDIFGPASSTDNAVARFDGTTGKAIQNSVVTIADSTGNMAGVGTISSGAITSSSLTSGRVLYAGTSGLIQDDADFTFNGTTVTMANDASISGLTVGKGANGVSQNTAVGGGALASGSLSGNNNTSVGYIALAGNTTGSDNTAVGRIALSNNTTGSSNAAFGGNALYLNTTGADNSALGASSLTSNTTGGSNSALGKSSLAANTTGNNNAALGNSALASNTTASGNTAIGRDALQANTTASNNTAVGYQAGYSNTTGSINTAVGVQALYTNTTGFQNNSFGYQALYLNTTGNYNNAFGVEALEANTTGSSNTAMGDGALRVNTTADNNTAVGYTAMYTNTTGQGNTALGRRALYFNTTASDNVAIGNQALYANTTGTANVAIGQNALVSNTTASNNTAVGYQSLYANTTGADNTAVGRLAANANTTGASNVAMGNSALVYNTTGSYNVAVGQQALNSNTTASNNTAVGYLALEDNTTGTNNCAFGRFALRNCTTGTENTALGTDAGDAITTGTDNTLVGYGSGYLITTGSKNSVLGAYSGNQGSLDIRTASNYIVLSDGDGNPRLFLNNSGYAYINTTSDLIGAAHQLAVNGANEVRGISIKTNGGATYQNISCHNSATSGNNAFIYFYTESSATDRGFIDYNRGAGQVRYNTTSDAALKNIIGDSDGTKSVDILKSTRIREYAWKEDAEQKPQVGVIAQELYETYKGAVAVGGEDTDGRYRSWAVDKTAFTFHLIAGWQAHEKLIQELNAKVTALEAQLKGN